jgi:hypothetical protein
VTALRWCSLSRLGLAGESFAGENFYMRHGRCQIQHRAVQIGSKKDIKERKKEKKAAHHFLSEI